MLKKIFLSIAPASLCCFLVFAECLVAADMPVRIMDDCAGVTAANISFSRTDNTVQTVKEIIEAEKNGLIVFEKLQKSNFGYTKDVFWVRFAVSSEEDETLLLDFNYPLVDSVHLYVLSDKEVIHDELIDDEAFSTGLMPDKNPLFTINTLSSQVYDIYLRVQTSGTMRLPIKIWSFNSYIKYRNRYNLFAGIYYGILAVLFFITFVIFFYHRLRSYVCFAMFVLSAGLFFSLQDGTFFAVIQPEFIRWKYNIYIFVGTMSIVILTEFVYELFVSKTVSFYLRMIYYIIFIMGFLTVTVQFFCETSVSLSILSILSIASFVPNFIAGIIGIRAGKKSANYFLAGLLFLMISIMVFALRGFGILPVNVVTLYAKDAGVLLMIIITSIGIIDVFSNYRIQSITDSLTGLVNRRYFFDLAQKEIDRSIRHNSVMSLVVIDVDHFKNINDKYGHSAGDRVLYELAVNLKSGLRSIDDIARLGGEEFVCILPDTDLSRGLMVAERLRKSVEAMEIVYDKHTIKFTISAGVAVSCSDQCSIGSLLEIADLALYRAKRAGRNKVFTQKTGD